MFPMKSVTFLGLWLIHSQFFNPFSSVSLLHTEPVILNLSMRSIKDSLSSVKSGFVFADISS